MNKTKTIVIIVFFALCTCYLLLGFYSANNVIVHVDESIQKKNRVATVLNFNERLLNAKEWILSSSVWKEKNKVAMVNLKYAKIQYNKAITEAQTIVWYSIAIFLIGLLAGGLMCEYWRFMCISVLMICAVFLFAGVSTPMLEIAAFNDNLTIPIVVKASNIPLLNYFSSLSEAELDLSKTFKGRMYYYYQSKSIISLINLLFKNRNPIVGIAILCFSIIIPFFKLFFTFLFCVFPGRLSKIKLSIVGAVGKWSMADVMVAACFLAFLSFSNMNTGVQTESKVLIGLTFFISYVILSIASGILAKMHLKDMLKIVKNTPSKLI